MAEVEMELDELRCPGCGESSGLRHTTVIVRSRSAEDEPGIEVVVDSTGHATTSYEERSFVGRRNDLCVKFDCEHCPDKVYVLTLVQHKGTTYMRWADDSL